MLDDDNAVTAFYKTLQHLQQLVYVRNMQSCRRLVQDIYGASRTAARKLRCQLYALCFAAAQRRRCLSQMNVAKAYILQHCQLAVNARLILKELAGLAYRHIKNLRD